MNKRFPIAPAKPERVCWGCDRYCRADAMQCGNGSIATPHPSELFGDDWLSWGLDAPRQPEAQVEASTEETAELRRGPPGPDAGAPG